MKKFFILSLTLTSLIFANTSTSKKFFALGVGYGNSGIEVEREKEADPFHRYRALNKLGIESASRPIYDFTMGIRNSFMRSSISYEAVKDKTYTSKHTHTLTRGPVTQDIRDTLSIKDTPKYIFYNQDFYLSSFLFKDFELVPYLGFTLGLSTHKIDSESIYFEQSTVGGTPGTPSITQANSSKTIKGLIYGLRGGVDYNLNEYMNFSYNISILKDSAKGDTIETKRIISGTPATKYYQTEMRYLIKSSFLVSFYF